MRANSFPKILLPLIAIAIFLPSGEVSAHATPVVYEPVNGGIFPDVPSEVLILFSERVEPGASNITVYAPDGSTANQGEGVVDSSDPHKYGVAIKGNGQGNYTVSWRVVSADDGHFTKGAFGFSVGLRTSPAAQSPDIQVVHSSSWPEAMTIGTDLLGQAILLSALVILGVWRRGRQKFRELEEAHQSFSGQLRVVVLLSCLLIFTGAVAYLTLRSSELQGVSGTPFWDNFQDFAGTASGSYTVYRGLAGILFAIIFLIFRKKISESESRTKAEWALFAILVFMAFTRARISHAAASHLWPEFSILVNWVHVLFKELWIGGVILSTWIYFAFARGKSRLVNYFLANLSKTAIWALAVGGVSGAYIVWLHLKDPANLFGTIWGHRFFVLSLWAGALLLVRLYHQLIVQKKLAERAGGVGEGGAPVRNLKFTLLLESLIALAVLFSSSLMIITTPPLPGGKAFERSSTSQDAHIMLTNKESTFFLEVHSGSPVKKVVVSLSNDEKSVGPIVVEPEKSGAGYDIPKSFFSPPGEWRIDITAQKEEGYDSVASFKVDYPKELAAPEAKRNWQGGPFEGMTLLAMLLIFGLAKFLSKKNYLFEG